VARVYQVPQHAFIWLITGSLLASIPQMMNGPVWIAAVVLFLQCWRVLVQRGRLRMPGRVLRISVLATAVGLTLYSYGTLFGPDAGITLLVCAFNLKLLEMNKMRDAYVVIVLNYFVLATVLIVRQDFLISLYVFVVLFFVTAALIGINQPEANIRARSQLRYAAALVAQAFPLMIFLFVVVPRVAPLWEMKSDQKKAKTGMSDSMAPGEVAELSRSAELAFRVQFIGEAAPKPERYWRGLTYSWYDGRRWSQALPQNISASDVVAYPSRFKPRWYSDLERSAAGPQYQYRIILEPTSREWLYAMTTPFIEQNNIGVVSDYRLISASPVTDSLSYTVKSYTRMPRGIDAPRWEKEFNLRLPAEGNPRSRAQAREWRAQAGSDDQYIARVMRMFRQQKFFYTLTPPPLGPDQVDDFLFRTRAGFCEHYASSFAVMMRAAGIPARIVAGYQGGEENPLGTHLLVRQYDAHAWVEVWLPESGWVEMDPTAMVAPERIESGLEQALQSQGSEFASAFNEAIGVSRLPILKQLASAMDYIEFNWASIVLGYDGMTQTELLKKWLGEVSPLRIALLIAAGIGIIGLFFAVLLLWRGRRPSLEWWQKEYWRLHSALRKRGVEIPDHPAPGRLVELVSAQAPAAAEALKQWRECYEGVAYRANSANLNGMNKTNSFDKQSLKRFRRIALRNIS
jgi:transglutaminase-like putative cysteine protease|tara:strand:- start:59996 stop:62050 length:2055 start_codon:yes stop_codon:yes gene_type:complete